MPTIMREELPSEQSGSRGREAMYTVLARLSRSDFERLMERAHRERRVSWRVASELIRDALWRERLTGGDQ